jgi:hypothetical protein
VQIARELDELGRAGLNLDPGCRTWTFKRGAVFLIVCDKGPKVSPPDRWSWWVRHNPSGRMKGAPAPSLGAAIRKALEAARALEMVGQMVPF